MAIPVVRRLGPNDFIDATVVQPDDARVEAAANSGSAISCLDMAVPEAAICFQVVPLDFIATDRCPQPGCGSLHCQASSWDKSATTLVVEPLYCTEEAT